VSTIHPVINQVGAWRLHPFGLNIMTTNQSEAFNSVLKRLQQYKEVPVDVMAMSLFRLSQFHMCEIQRGHAGNGNYMLRSGIARVTTDADHADPGSPSSIVDRLIDAAQPPPAAADSTVLTQSDPQATLTLFRKMRALIYQWQQPKCLLESQQHWQCVKEPQLSLTTAR